MNDYLKEKLIVSAIIIGMLIFIGYILVALIQYGGGNCEYCQKLCEEKYKLYIDDSMTGCEMMCEETYGKEACQIEKNAERSMMLSVIRKGI